MAWWRLGRPKTERLFKEHHVYDFHFCEDEWIGLYVDGRLFSVHAFEGSVQALSKAADIYFDEVDTAELWHAVQEFNDDIEEQHPRLDTEVFRFYYTLLRVKPNLTEDMWTGIEYQDKLTAAMTTIAHFWPNLRLGRVGDLLYDFKGGLDDAHADAMESFGRHLIHSNQGAALSLAAERLTALDPDYDKIRDQLHTFDYHLVEMKP